MRLSYLSLHVSLEIGISRTPLEKSAWSLGVLREWGQ